MDNLRKKLYNSYYIGIIFIMIKLYLQVSMLITDKDKIESIINLVIVICFVIKLLIQKYDKKSFGLTIITGVIITITSYICKDYSLIFCYLPIVASRDVELKNTIKLIFGVGIVLMSIHIIFYFYDYFFNNNKLIKMYNKSKQIRHYCYILHPNVFAGLMFGMVAQWTFIRFEKLNYKDISICSIVLIFTFLLSKSRTTLIISILLMFFLVFHKIKGENRCFNIISQYIFPCLAIITIICCFLYGNEIINKLDVLLSNRITLTNYAVENYGLTFVPRNIDLSNRIKHGNYSGEFCIDSLYSRCYVIYGIIYLFIFTFLFYLMGKEKKNKYSIYIIIFCLMSFTERYISINTIGFILITLTVLLEKYIWNDKKLENKV